MQALTATVLWCPEDSASSLFKIVDSYSLPLSLYRNVPHWALGQGDNINVPLAAQPSTDYDSLCTDQLEVLLINCHSLHKETHLVRSESFISL